MKSLANDLLKVELALLNDVQVTYPVDETEISRDRKRLVSLVKERGLGVFTLDLPALDEVLIQGLESSRLTLGCALSKRASPRVLVPKLFRGLWLRIFNVDGTLSEKPDETAIFFLRQLCCLGKKLEVECSPTRLRKATKEYFDVERELRAPTLRWESDELGSETEMANCSFDDYNHHFDEHQPDLWGEPPKLRDDVTIRTLLRRLQINSDFFSLAIGEYDPLEFSNSNFTVRNSSGLNHGPGAVADPTKERYKYVFPNWPLKLDRLFGFNSFGRFLPGQDDSLRGTVLSGDNQLSFKYESVCNQQDVQGLVSSLYDLGSKYSGIRSYRPRSMEKDVRSLRKDSILRGIDRPGHHEPCSRLLAVPKTAKGPRLIAAEPTAHQWCQQLTKLFLSERLKGLFADNFICFEKQQLSQGMVISASLDKRLATVDLSSASDRLSCAVVERAFRRNPSVLRALHAHRTRWLVTDKTISDTREYLRLKKFASQGTAVTFPVQTIIFFLCAITASGFLAQRPEDFICNNRICNPISKLRNKVRVYGDDIIIPTDGYGSLTLLLHVLGLKVNESKSFFRGSFRESCGMDAFAGVDVTPVKPKRICATGPQSRQAIIDTSNLFFTKGLWNASEAYMSILPGWVRKNLPVGRPDCGAVCRFSFVGNNHEHLRKRYNEKLQRYEIRTYGIRSRVRRIPTNLPQSLLQFYTENPSPDVNWASGRDSRPKISDGLRWEFPFWNAG